jgi:hypothetical protein
MEEVDSRDDQASTPGGSELAQESIDIDIRTISKRACPITVEPMLFVNVVGLGALAVTVQSFIISTVCSRRNEGSNASHVDCDNLSAYTEEGISLGFQLPCSKRIRC